MSARSARSQLANGCLWLAAFVVLGAAAHAPDPVGSARAVVIRPNGTDRQELTVCVTDGRGRPVAGVTVVLVGTLHGSVSDTAGCVRFPSVAPGAYLLRAVIDGYGLEEVAVVLNPDTPGYVEVTLRRQGLEQRRTADAEAGLLTRFDAVAVVDGYVASGVQRRTGSHAEGTRRLVNPLSERLRDFSSGRVHTGLLGGMSDLDTYAVRPFVGAAATSNTESVVVEAAAGSATDRRGYAAHLFGAGAAPFRDGAGAAVDSRYRTNQLSISTFVATHRLRFEFVGGALLDTRGSRPATGVDVDRAIAARGRFALDVRDGIGGSTYRFELGGIVSNEAWATSSIPGAPSYSMVGAHDRYEVDATAQINYSVSEQLRASSTVGARLVTQEQESRFEDGVETGITSFPQLRDGVFDISADLVYSTSLLDVSGSVGLTAVRSARELRNEVNHRSSLVLPNAKIAVRMTRSVLRVAYELHHAQWLPSYEVRSRAAGYFWSGQQLLPAVSSPAIDRGRSTLQRVGFELPRGSVALHAALSVEFLHDVTSVHSAADGSALATVAADAGWTSTLSAGISWEPLGGVRSGVVGHFLRAHNETLQTPLASLPSSAVGGFVEIAPLGDYPFVRWTSEQRFSRTRVSVQPEEVETPGSLETNVEVGVRIRNFAVSFGVLNMGDRVVRDHTSTRTFTRSFEQAAGEPSAELPAQSAEVAAANLPGRRFRVAVRLQLPD